MIKAEGQRNRHHLPPLRGRPCVRSCPNDAIAQSGDSVQVRQEKCIGCKSCMVACPFGVMQVVVTPQAAGPGEPARKCVRSRGREAGPACVENCPAQALTLADDETLITSAEAAATARSACQEVQPWQRATPLCSQPNAGAKVQANGDDAPRAGAG